jgi:hypothetical protein
VAQPRREIATSASTPASRATVIRRRGVLGDLVMRGF